MDVLYFSYIKTLVILFVIENNFASDLLAFICL